VTSRSKIIPKIEHRSCSCFFFVSQAVDDLAGDAGRRYVLPVPDISGPEDAASARLLLRVLWAILVFVGSICLFVALLWGHFQSREFDATTPTSATIDFCSKGRSGGAACSGTWILNGQQHRGYIDGVANVLPPGSAVDVRADRYHAFASAPAPYQPAAVVSGVLVAAAVALTIWGWLRKTATRRR
jgi:hypothetical protein